MISNDAFYFGNAITDQVRDSGWFVGQFVASALGLRHQRDVEIKWGVHPDGEKRLRPWANNHATTISVLIRGCLQVTFHAEHTGEPPHLVRMGQEGDYLIFAPGTVHSWEAIGETVVLSVRFPSIEVWEAARAVGSAAQS